MNGITRDEHIAVPPIHLPLQPLQPFQFQSLEEQQAVVSYQRVSLYGVSVANSYTAWLLGLVK